MDNLRFSSCYWWENSMVENAEGAQVENEAWENYVTIFIFDKFISSYNQDRKDAFFKIATFLKNVL